MTPRILLGSFEVPGLGGSSTASFSLFARMQSEGRDVHYVNLIHADKARFTDLHGKNVGNPRELSNVTNCWLSGDLERVHPHITTLVNSISPDFGVAFGYIAALLLKRAMPNLPIVLVIGTCRQAQDYVTSGRVKDATSLLRILKESKRQLRPLNRSECASVDGSELVISHSALALELMNCFYSHSRDKLHQRIVSFAEWICDDAVREQHRARAFDDRDIDVLFVASDWRRPEKNLSLLSAVAKRFRGRTIHVVGNMPRRLKGVEQHGFVPDRRELFDLLGRSRSVVCPSLIDAAPGILFEASVLGCNVVASRNCGNWDLCHPDLLVDPFGVDGFASCIERALLRKYDDNLEKFLSLRSYDDLMATLDAVGRPFRGISSQKSDVSALVLSIGEAHTERGLASLEAQTLSPADVVIVKNMSPFSRALNAGVQKIKTKFFVQVDADMVLDPECFEMLRSAATDGVGMVVGELRDPLMGRVVGVKLFRTKCFERFPFRDSVSPDTDYVKEIERIGMRVVYLSNNAAANEEQQPTFGDHLPEYTAAYTYRKFAIEGARLRHRGSRPGLRWRLERLESSRHPLALLARVAMADGFFDRSDVDALKPFEDNGDAERLTALLESSDESDQASSGLLPINHGEKLSEIFRRFFQAGRVVAHAQAGRTARAVFDSLRDCEADDMRLSVAAVAFGRGLVSPNLDPNGIASDEDMMRRFASLGLPRKARTMEIIRARAVRLVGFVGVGGPAARW